MKLTKEKIGVHDFSTGCFACGEEVGTSGEVEIGIDIQYDSTQRQVNAYIERLRKAIEGMLHKPHLYHHLCYGTIGIVVIKDVWSQKKIYHCDIYKPDGYGCSPNKCPHKGILKGFLQLTPSEVEENRAIQAALQKFDEVE